MRGGLIVWDADSVAHLEDMIRATENEGGDTVPFVNGKRNTFRPAEPTHQWPMEEAKQMLYQAKATLAAHPMPRFSENREGEEP
jgi:hypothetical protein